MGNVQKKGMGTINKEKTREIERFALIKNFNQAVSTHTVVKFYNLKLRLRYGFIPMRYYPPHVHL